MKRIGSYCTPSRRDGGCPKYRRLALPVGSASSLILVVEDERLIRRTVVGEFRFAGWKVLEACTAEDAIDRIETVPRIDVLFTEIRLAGGLDGWDVADAFRKLHPYLPVIYSSAGSVDHCRQLSDSRFFRKPYNASDILDACMRFRELGYCTLGQNTA
jgi:CheY-like chemotaxis protein